MYKAVTDVALIFHSVHSCSERGSVVVSTPAWHAGDLGLIPRAGML